MRVAVTGARGLIGSALVAALRDRGDEVIVVHRSDEPDPHGEPAFSPSRGQAWLGGLDGVDALVHLAGAPIGERRWNAHVRSEIYGSRVLGTKAIVRGLAELAHPPRVVVSASAIGVYGDRGDEELTEQSPPGEGFLSRVVQDWESEASQAASLGARVVLLRTGIVLAGQGGVLARLCPLARFGLAGPLGSGHQFMSWISLEDEVRAILHVLAGEVAGPVNLVGPEPVRNRDFARTLGQVVHRPSVLPAPAFLLELALGPAMARELLLASQRVRPEVLLGSGFEFRHLHVGDALAWALGAQR
jgi:uncharacterized protein (TIGR01777 family)